jgi:hypothetical protein
LHALAPSQFGRKRASVDSQHKELIPVFGT